MEHEPTEYQPKRGRRRQYSPEEATRRKRETVARWARAHQAERKAYLHEQYVTRRKDPPVLEPDDDECVFFTYEHQYDPLFW